MKYYVENGKTRDTLEANNPTQAVARMILRNNFPPLVAASLYNGNIPQ